MNRDQKTAVVAEIAEQIESAGAIFAVDYRGISVAQIANLRAQLREADARFRVVKNSLTERAADKAGAPDLKAMLIGPTALALVSGDAALAAKALNDAARRLNLLEFKGGLLNGAVLSADDVRSIARLPSREILQAQLVGTLAAPLTGLVRGLNALIAGIAIQLQAIVDQGLVRAASPEELAAQSAAEAPAAEPVDAAPEALGEAEAPAAQAEVPAVEAEARAAEAEAPAAVGQAPAAEAEAPAAVGQAPAAEAEAPAAEAEAEAPADEPEAPAAAPEATVPVGEPEAPVAPAAPAAEPEAAAPAAEPEAAAAAAEPEAEAAAAEPEAEARAADPEAAAETAPEQKSETETEPALDAKSSDDKEEA